MNRVAITGGIACGKSLAGDYLASLDVPVIDADAVVHQLLASDDAVKAAILNYFGSEILDDQGSVSRPLLAKRVFEDAPARRFLEQLIHPKVREVIAAFFQEHSQAQLAVALIPLLFESGLADRYDQVWLLASDEETQVARLIQNRGFTQSEAMARLKSQMSLSQKLEQTRQHPGGKVIWNHADPQALYDQLSQCMP